VLEEVVMFRITLPIRLIAMTALLAGAAAHADAPSAAQGNVTPLLSQPLAGIEGKEVTMVSVTYPPGGASAPHRHNADVFVYVLEGSVVMQVDGGQPVTLNAGQTFHESPTDVHRVSKNASATQSAKILAILVKNSGAPATVPVE
jgi:quercetin dioxygenase-like cupin family protein